jgi:hypothetical protein
MEIKELVERIQSFKKLRNDIEFETDFLAQEIQKQQEEVDEQDRVGLHFCADLTGIDDSFHKFKYAISTLNEGIGILEMSYRRSIRLKKVSKNIVEDKSSENKEV